MKRLKLKAVSESPQQHDPDIFVGGYVEKFNKALEEYCRTHKNKNIPYYTWVSTVDDWPLDLNEDILVFTENNNFQVYRSFTVLQNLIYKQEVLKTSVGTKFHWMRIKTPSGKPLYENN
jgi:hypothetical protein